MSGPGRPMRVFPSRAPGVAASLSEEPVEIDGMKVLFDQPVALQPVSLAKPGSRSKRARTVGPSGNGGRSGERWNGP